MNNQSTDEQIVHLFMKALNNKFLYKHIYTNVKTRKYYIKQNPDNIMMKE